MREKNLDDRKKISTQLTGARREKKCNLSICLHRDWLVHTSWTHATIETNFKTHLTTSLACNRGKTTPTTYFKKKKKQNKTYPINRLRSQNFILTETSTLHHFILYLSSIHVHGRRLSRHTFRSIIIWVRPVRRAIAAFIHNTTVQPKQKSTWMTRYKNIWTVSGKQKRKKRNEIQKTMKRHEW